MISSKFDLILNLIFSPDFKLLYIGSIIFISSLPLNVLGKLNLFFALLDTFTIYSKISDNFFKKIALSVGADTVSCFRIL